MTFQLPAHLANRPSRSIAEAAMSGLNTGQPARVSIRRNTFTLVDAAGNEKGVPPLNVGGVAVMGLDVVVVDANPHLSKIYFKNKFDPSATDYAPPTCFSDNGKGASVRADEPQHTSCQVCPHNAWGSDVSVLSGRNTKACDDVKKIVVIVPGLAGGEPFLLRIPPATLKIWGKYVQTVAGQVVEGRRVDVSDLVTRITFDPQTQGVLNFQPVAWVDEPTVALIDALYTKQVTARMVGADDLPWDGTGREPAVAPARAAGQLPPPPQPVQQQAAPAPAAQPFMPSAEPPKPARTRRTKEQIAADEAGKAGQNVPFTPAMNGPTAQAQPDNLDIPPFLQRQGTTPPAPKPDAAPFGVVANPPAPSGAISEALAQAFKLPT